MIMTAWTGTTEVSAQSLPTVYLENINHNVTEPEPGFTSDQATIAVKLSQASTSTVTVTSIPKTPLRTQTPITCPSTAPSLSLQVQPGVKPR